MIKKLFILFLLIPSISFANVSEGTLQSVFSRIKAVTGLNPRLEIIKSNKINAWADGRRVILTTGMMGYLSSSDQLAVVLGHEFAHILNYDNYKPGRKSHELNADTLGASLAQRAGYNACSGISYFKSRIKVDKGDATHPPMSYRYERLANQFCR
jgi:predicted Zn-dependent protease